MPMTRLGGNPMPGSLLGGRMASGGRGYRRGRRGRIEMTKFKLGLVIGFTAGWAVGSGKAAEMVARLRESAGSGGSGSVGSGAPRTIFDRGTEASAVSA